MKKPNNYVVTFRYPDLDNKVTVKIINGNDLAAMVGFSDCIPVEIIEVWEMSSYGNLMPVSIYYPDHAPHNRLMVEDVCGIVKEYYWEEH